MMPMLRTSTILPTFAYRWTIEMLLGRELSECAKYQNPNIERKIIEMKFLCNKGYDADKVFNFIAEYIKKESLKYPLLAENLEIEISLKNVDGEVYQDNNKTIHLGEKELNLIHNTDKELEHYYSRDVLTDLYNRSKYERDLNILQMTGYEHLICVYIDAIGLHEINNHLGHNAGDQMLCSIAEGIREFFPDCLSYRIGGDEFIILGLNYTKAEASEKSFSLKQKIKKQEYEISVGIGESTDSTTLNTMIDYAENAMRCDKMEFYRNNGGLRQMRSLNHRLEKLILEKQDANHFLDVIAPSYKGVYIVNSEKDTCRYIYVPPYFQEMLDNNKGSFSLSMRDYCRELVQPEYHEQLEKLLDYNYIQEQLTIENIVHFTYQKKDDSWIDLKITFYDQMSDTNEMLWIFLHDRHI